MAKTFIALPTGVLRFLTIDSNVHRTWNDGAGGCKTQFGAPHPVFVFYALQGAIGGIRLISSKVLIVQNVASIPAINFTVQAPIHGIFRGVGGRAQLEIQKPGVIIVVANVVQVVLALLSEPDERLRGIHRMEIEVLIRPNYPIPTQLQRPRVVARDIPRIQLGTSKVFLEAG